MPQEPWRRAYELSRLREQEKREPPRRGPSPLLVLFVLLLVAAAAGTGGYFYWRSLGAREVEQLRSEMVETLPEQLVPTTPVDAGALDDGLGIALRPTGDYLELLEATRPWGVEWQVRTSGSGTLRLSAPGVRVSTSSGRIRAYEIDLPEVFAADVWTPWHETLTAANIAPQRTRLELLGSEDAADPEEYVLSGTAPIQLDGSAVRPVYSLQFEGGRLTVVKGGLEIVASQTQ